LEKIVLKHKKQIKKQVIAQDIVFKPGEPSASGKNLTIEKIK